MVKLQRISVMPVAKLFCGFHALVGLIVGAIASILSMTNQGNDGFWNVGPWSVLVFPLVNAGLGFLTGAFLAFGYNLFSRFFGGIELEIDKNIESLPHLSSSM